jgi:hypothetical protein
MRKPSRPSIPGRKPRERAAVYATVQERDGSTVTFRVGQPMSGNGAWNRHDRLAGTGATFKRGAILYRGRRLSVKFYEVRHVDRYGRRLDSNRADQVLPVPYSAHRVHGR